MLHTLYTGDPCAMLLIIMGIVLISLLHTWRLFSLLRSDSAFHLLDIHFQQRFAFCSTPGTSTSLHKPTLSSILAFQENHG